MSLSIRITAKAANVTSYGYASPWYLYAGDDGDAGVLLLHSEANDAQLDEEDPADLIWRAGFLPAANSVEKSSAVDAASGGDLDQLRETTVLVANQMADGTLMTEFVAANGIRLKGARIEIFAGVPSSAGMPASYWAGRISQAKPEGLSISLACEPDGDDAPIGTMLGDSVIRPLVIGTASNVKLNIIQDETSYPNLTKIGYSTWDPPAPTFPSLRTSAAELLHLSSAQRLFMFINAKTAGVDDEYLQLFPDGIVPDGNWTLEVVSGAGKGGVRAIEAGSGVYVWRGTGTEPHLTLPNFRKIPNGTTYNVPTPYGTGYISFQLAPFFATFDAWGTMSDFSLVANAGRAIGGQEEDWTLGDTSYLRLVRRDLRLSKPEHASAMLFKFRSNNQMGAYNSFGVIDEGDRYLVDFRRHPSSRARLFRKLPILSTLDIRALQNGTGTTVSDNIRKVFDDEPESVDFVADQHGLYIGIRKVGPDGSEISEHLSGGKRLWLSIDADYEGELFVRLSIFGRQKSTYSAFDRVDVFPMRLADSGKLFAPLSGGCKLLFDWEPGYSDTIGISASGGMWVTIPDELEVVQYIQIFLGIKDAPIPSPILPGPFQDESTWWGDTSTRIHSLTINSMALHVEIETGIDSVWSDITGPTYQSCPGGIDREIEGVTVNSFAVERNAYDYPLSSGIVQDAPIDDHVHAIEALLRMQGYHGDHIDTESYETAYWDMVTKSRTSLAPESVALRPKCSIAISKVTQIGDAIAQLCRDGGLIGGRNAANKRTLKAFLARTRIAEQDYVLKDYYADGTPSDFLRSDLTEGSTSINAVVTSPLIRYAMEAGKASRYVQVLHPDAPTYDASYCIGFESPADAEAAWNICHEGWLRTGMLLARELTMASVSAYSTLIKLLMPQRGCGQLEWMSRQKRTLTYVVADTHAVASAPNGSRIHLTHWLRAPSGVRGTLVSTTSRRSSGYATQTVIVDPEA